MEADTHQYQPLVGFLVLNAIPLVSYILWGQYFQQDLERLEEENPKYDRAIECQRIRVSGFLSSLAVLLIFLASKVARATYPIETLLTFVSALFFQLHYQSKLEGKVRTIEASATEQLQLGTRALLWALIGGAIYSVTLLSAVVLSFFVATWVSDSKVAMAAIVFTGCGVGVWLGLFVNYALGAIFVRKTLPHKEMEDPKWINLIKNSFERAGLQTPRLFVLETDRFGYANALIAGFSFGRGIFRPGLFISKNMLRQFSHKEVDAVIQHEVAHLRLKHLQRRFITSFIAILAAAFLATSLGITAQLAIPQSPVAALVGPMSAVISFIGAMIYIKRQSFKHEFEADLAAISLLGANPQALVSALTKIDLIQSQPLDGMENNPLLALPRMHPTTLARIRKIEKWAEQNPSNQISIDSDVPPSQKAA